MPTLYIANPTNQTQMVAYRLEYTKEGELKPNLRFRPATMAPVEPGRQIVLGERGMHQKNISSVLDQLRAYGLVEFENLGQVKGDQSITYIARVDLAVPPDAIRRAEAHNRRMKTIEGNRRRAAAAIAVDRAVQRTVEEQFLEQGIPARPADTTSVSYETVESPSDVESTPIAEAFDIVPEGKLGPHNQRPGDLRKSPIAPRKARGR